jgi:hypothetical protein
MQFSSYGKFCHESLIAKAIFKSHVGFGNAFKLQITWAKL